MHDYERPSRHRLEQYTDFMARLYPELHDNEEDAVYTGISRKRIISRQLTFQVTDACNLCCSYCY